MDGNGILTNETDVKNVGMAFNTIVANVRVWGGKWYYEVTLGTHGLMQIGWATDQFVPVPQSGIGVGDDGQGQSWSVDLFRKVKWRKGVSTPFGHRKWAAGRARIPLLRPPPPARSPVPPPPAPPTRSGLSVIEGCVLVHSPDRTPSPRGPPAGLFLGTPFFFVEDGL